MNLEQQQQLIQSQVQGIHQDEQCRLIPQDDPFQLHLDLACFNNQRYHAVLDLSNYDIEPPRFYIVDENGVETWDESKLPPHPILNLNPYPGTDPPRRFFCIKGTSEYHEHPLHKHERWDWQRNELLLPEFVARLRQVFNQAPQEILIPIPPEIMAQIQAGKKVQVKVQFKGAAPP